MPTSPTSGALAAPGMSVVVPAHDEESTIGELLTALGRTVGGGPGLEIIVAANACTDNTVAVARGLDWR